MPVLNQNASLPANESNGQIRFERCYFDDSFAVQICKLLAYCAVLLIGLVGNSALVVVIYKRGQDLRNTVNCFIMNMAISDLAFCLAGVPMKLIQLSSNSFHWHVNGVAGSVLCKLYKFSKITLLTVSLQSILWLSVDRFIAIMFPMRARNISPRHRGVAIACTWGLALAVRAPYVMVVNLGQYKNMTYCGLWDIFVVFENENVFRSFTLTTEIIFLMFPLISITILYFLIAITLKRRNKNLARLSPHIQLQAYNKNSRAAKMSFCTMLAYGVCFVPYMVYQYTHYSSYSCSMFRFLSFFVVFMLYLSSTVNPVICFLFVQSFSFRIREMLSNCSKRNTLK